MLHAYFDDSGHPGSSKIFALAGVLGKAEAWEELLLRWHPLLTRYELSEMHMYDVVNCRGDCKLKEKWVRQMIHKECYDALQGINLIHVASAVVMDDWNSLDQASKSRLGSPYQLCFQTCVQTVANGLRVEVESPDFEPVDFVFDQADKAIAQLAVENFLEHKSNPAYSPFLGSITFDDSKRKPGIQVADLFAYHCYKFTMKRLGLPEGQPDFELMPLHLKQLDAMSVAAKGLWDSEAMHDLLTEISQKEHA